MGCISSSPVHPGIQGVTGGKENARAPKERKARGENPNHLYGDYTQFQLAKHNREKKHKNRQFELFIAADEMTVKMLEHREMLSLGSRSRNTSRNTSRAASPSTGRRPPKEPVEAPMTPVVEDHVRTGSYRSEDPEPVTPNSNQNEPNKETESPNRKHKKHKSGKHKSKSKKHQNKSKGDKSDKLTNDGVDSGLDEEVEDEDKNNDVITQVTNENSVNNTNTVTGSGLNESENGGDIRNVQEANGENRTSAAENGEVVNGKEDIIHSASNDSGIDQSNR